MLHDWKPNSIAVFLKHSWAAIHYRFQRKMEFSHQVITCNHQVRRLVVLCLIHTDGDEDLETAMQLVEIYSSKQLREKSHAGESGDKDSHDKVTSTFCHV